MNGVPEFRFNLGGGVTIVKADRPVSLNEWHTIKIVRYRKKGNVSNLHYIIRISNFSSFFQ